MVNRRVQCTNRATRCCALDLGPGPNQAARCSGVEARVLRAFTFAAERSSASTMSWLPCATARCSGDHLRGQPRVTKRVATGPTPHQPRTRRKRDSAHLFAVPVLCLRVGISACRLSSSRGRISVWQRRGGGQRPRQLATASGAHHSPAGAALPQGVLCPRRCKARRHAPILRAATDTRRPRLMETSTKPFSHERGGCVSQEQIQFRKLLVIFINVVVFSVSCRGGGGGSAHPKASN